ncbi:MAG: peptidase, partial [Deltaproteobacteria bacterium]
DRIAGPTLSKKNEYELGIRVSELTMEIARHFNITEAVGVIVIDVESESQGMEAGIRVGDIIKEINHQPIETVKDYKNGIEKLKKGDPIQMFIKRVNGGFDVVMLTK